MLFATLILTFKFSQPSRKFLNGIFPGYLPYAWISAIEADESYDHISIHTDSYFKKNVFRNLNRELFDRY